MHFSAGQDVTIKKLQRSNLFQLTIFKHGLLEGSTTLLQYSSISRTKLESSRLGELKYALLAGYDIRLKNESFERAKRWHFTTGIHGHCSMGCQRDRHYYFDTATQAVHRWIALDWGSKNMQFQEDSTSNVRGITLVLDVRSKNNSFRKRKIQQETAIEQRL